VPPSLLQFEDPEIVRMPIESVLLSMKTLGIDCAARFPFPSPPPPTALHAAVRCLTNLGALVPRVRALPQGSRAAAHASAAVSGGAFAGIAAPEGTVAAVASLSSIVSEALTPLGRAVAALPLHPSLGKMLVLAAQAGAPASASAALADGSPSTLLEYTIAMVACLTVQQLFQMPSGGPAAASSGKDGADGDGGDSDAVDSSDEEGGGGARSRQALSAAERELLAELEGDDAAEGAHGSGGGASNGAGGGDEEADARLMSSEEARRRARVKAAEEAERQRRQELRNAAAAAHARFRHPLSDALSMLRACGAYSHALQTGGDGAAAAFCRSHFLRGRAMREVTQLRRQLHRAVYTDLLPTQARTQAATAAAGADAAAAAEEAQAAAPALARSGGGDENELEDGQAERDAGAADDSDAEAEEAAAAAAAAAAANNGKSGQQKTKQTPAQRRAAATAKRPALPPFRVALSPPSAATETLLRQVLAAGQLERVAKRAPPTEAAALMEAAGIGPKIARTLVPYIPSSAAASSGAAGGALFVHPLSSVFERDVALMPELICYSEVVTSRRAYMRGVTAVDREWLHSVAAGTPMVRYSDPLETPPPVYVVTDRASSAAAGGSAAAGAGVDQAMCHVIPAFGERQWKLPPAQVPHPHASPADADAILRLFARGLLEGRVAPLLKIFTPYLSVPAAAITKRAQQSRVVLLLETLKSPPRVRGGAGGGALTQGAVSSARQLADVWAVFPAYLKTDVKAWLPVEMHSKLDVAWPEIVAQFLRRQGVASAVAPAAVQ
jgi:HrpA-like RNA helicase